MTAQSKAAEAAAPAATEKDMFIMSAEREFQTTLRVLEAYPEDQLDLKPAEKSMSARELIWLLSIGKRVTKGLLAGKFGMGEAPPPVPKTKAELIEAFKQAQAAQIAAVSGIDEATFHAPIEIPSGPGTTTRVRRADALWTFAMDGIHHRGQLTVYLRMAGGRVPSIYGPSGDEPW
jgi:uncharacterized damage-inducible protein DinB